MTQPGSKMRVLFVGALTDPVGGARGGQLTASMNLYHSELGERVQWLPLSSTFATVPAPPLWKRSGSAVSRMWRFARLLAGADVVMIFAASGLSLFEKTFMAALARLTGKGVVIRMSGGPMLPQSEKHLSIRWTLKVALGVAHVVCSQGEVWTQFFEQLAGSRDKIIDAPNPLVVPDVVPRTPHAGKRLFFAGRLIREKGIFDLIPMFADVQQSFPGTVLSIAGMGEAQKEFESALEKADLRQFVNFLGWVPPEKMNDHFAETDVFVFPSYSEGMPNAVLEAMLAGTPVVSSNVGAVPDVIIPGETGSLFAPGDLAAFTRQVLGALADPAKSLQWAQAGRLRVSARHDASRVWRVYAGALNRAANEAGAKCSLIPLEENVLSAEAGAR